MAKLFYFLLAILLSSPLVSASTDGNRVHSPCSDTTVAVADGFTVGFAFASKQSFTHNNTQLSPCDRRLSLPNSNSQIAVFRPKVDEISLLTINTTSSFTPAAHGGFMVAFAGAKYAARSLPTFVADNSHTITSFTLVLEFTKGRLQNLYWKNEGCSRCTTNSTFVCLKDRGCAIQTTKCKNQGPVDCSLGIQLAFSGTDKHYKSLNSWYEVEKLRQYSLYGLFSDLKSSLTSQFNKII